MKRIKILILLMLSVFTIHAKLKHLVYAEKVDSIVIRTINWSVHFEQLWGIDRTAFDELFTYLEANPEYAKREHMDIGIIKIEDEVSRFLFCSMLNNLDEDTCSIFLGRRLLSPNEIVDRSLGFSHNKGEMIGYPSNGDYLGTRGQIKIYKNERVILEAYISPFSLEVYNCRYKLGDIAPFITKYLHAQYKKLNLKNNGVTVPDSIYDYALNIHEADSLIVYDFNRQSTKKYIPYTIKKYLVNCVKNYIMTIRHNLLTSKLAPN